jgi:stage III sporulation protein AH
LPGEEINKINDLQNAIMIAENLLTSKGFKQNIIFVNGESINIIIGKEELGQDEVAQIQNIVSRELKANLENIHIQTK